MKATDRAALCRVRMLVLQQIMAAGGAPAAWQVARALAPVCGMMLAAASPIAGQPPGEGVRPGLAIADGGRAFTCSRLNESVAGLSRLATVESGSRPSASSPPF